MASKRLRTYRPYDRYAALCVGRDAGVIHDLPAYDVDSGGANLQARNVHLRIEDDEEPKDFEDREMAEPNDTQPYIYRAPEVMLDIPWGTKVDIWNLGVLIWDLLEGRPLFTARGADGEQSVEFHLAKMVALLGPPPADFLQRIETSRDYFDSDGSWRASAPIPKTSFEVLETALEGTDKTSFLR
ncbi:Hypothetical protein R9X50_00438200 [Acrodontium crateriforme]|uniref:Protein kinase domain-containing protein n=1 Tax=Acrodontium crateriforme TaxID=150365 RepID=A0AAQ3R509_9PEZI|nr:Hypothetical protein R9X50_00438200 [Acrodontium crateriforme]